MSSAGYPETIPPARRVVGAVALALMLLALLAPALWNGFPIINADTGGYVARPIEATLSLGRSAFYGAFLAAGISLDFWPAVVAQAALVLWLIRLTLRCFGLGGRLGLALVVVVTLATLTELAWFVGQLSPDILAPVAVLASILLAYRADALQMAERLGLAAAVAVAIASHMAILALCFGLLAWYGVATALARWTPLPRPRLAANAAALTAGIVLCLSSNFLIAGQLWFTPGGPTFAFGRLLQDGVVARYLDDHCPDPTLNLCPFRHALPATADNWLWNNDSPLHALGGWQSLEPEERRIILATLRLYPAQHLITAAQSSLVQIVTLRTGMSVDPYANGHAVYTLEQLLPPSAVMRFHSARQQSELPDIEPLSLLHVPVAFVSMLFLLAVAMFGWDRRQGDRTALCLSILVALIGNAVVCGVFSTPSDRYQGRLVPLATLAALVVLAGAQRPVRVHAVASLIFPEQRPAFAKYDPPLRVPD